LHGDSDIGLWTVLEGASPDYAVIGQKMADAPFLGAFNPAFGRAYGITVPALANRYESQGRQRTHLLIGQAGARADARMDQQARELHHKLAEAEQRIVQVEQRVDYFAGLFAEIFASPAWKMTAPLRWLGTQVRLMRKMGFSARMRMAAAKLTGFAARKAISFADKHPRLRRAAVLTAKGTGLYRIFKPLYQRLIGQGAASMSATPEPTQSDMSMRANRLYQDLKTAVKRDKEPS
jgi:O-antigen chain-terminating methyltransferase